ncbi:uncharacterized protein A4U43_C08F1030 [Asparagus officinalis]|uniref:growth-regulating factor 4-like n=1 Tax=Asparagus officinalis TaxID=4686 RepID=UPI00098E29A5|nr:growth-regulating factor 4-like [Asparagus officinalis]ONK58915.1 uncharacterized protein A4U43_C08F1030 [Asparagus officinalis]
MLRSPFTAAQWQELEHQALILKYLLAGVPPDLLVPIRRSFGSLPAYFYPNPALSYCSYFGKKLDPEPGRCRRTDGKKWRCSKDAYPDSKYCERHMHRGKNRSRKPVESQTLSQLQSSSSTVTSLNPTGTISRSVQNSPLPYSMSSSSSAQASTLGAYGTGNKDYRYLNGVKTELNMHSFAPEASGSIKGLGVDPSLSSSWTSRDSSFSLSNSRNSSHSYSQLQQQQSSYLGSDFGLLQPVKEETNSLRPFFDEWPKTRELWSDLEDERSNQISFSNTQLSMSIPMASSDFSTTASRSTNNN